MDVDDDGFVLAGATGDKPLQVVVRIRPFGDSAEVEAELPWHWDAFSMSEVRPAAPLMSATQSFVSPASSGRKRLSGLPEGVAARAESSERARPKSNRALKHFRFDHVHGPEQTTQEIYDESIYGIIMATTQGYNATVFAYGQTGSGKTYTMLGTTDSPAAAAARAKRRRYSGSSNGSNGRDSDRSGDGAAGAAGAAGGGGDGDGDGEVPAGEGDRGEGEEMGELGVIPIALCDIFEKIRVMQEDEPGLMFLMQLSYMEIYNEEVNDLLVADGKANDLPILEEKDGPAVKGLTYMTLNSVEEALRIMSAGEKRRHMGATNMNERSSRSHTVLQIVLESSKIVTQDGDDGGADSDGSTGSVDVTTIDHPDNSTVEGGGAREVHQGGGGATRDPTARARRCAGRAST